jgi:hypothetical protein
VLDKRMFIVWHKLWFPDSSLHHVDICGYVNNSDQFW